MKGHWFAITLAILAVILTGLGGILDATKNGYYLTKQHAWNDGIFLMLLAIFVQLIR